MNKSLLLAALLSVLASAFDKGIARVKPAKAK